jgi:hypothetical protein
LTNGEPMMIVDLRSVNDQAPRFDQMIYDENVREDQTVGTIVLRVQAHDHDLGENSRLTYIIDDPTTTFDIQFETGEIFLRQPLDYERFRSYAIALYGIGRRMLIEQLSSMCSFSLVNDAGQLQLNGSVRLFINVTDVNDHRPNIRVPENKISQIHLSECPLRSADDIHVGMDRFVFL